MYLQYNSCWPTLQQKTPGTLLLCQETLFPVKWCRRLLLQDVMLRDGEVPLKYICSQHSKRNNTGFGDSHKCRLGCFFLKPAWSVTYWLNKMLCWGHIPNLCRMESMWVWMSRPPTSTVPDVGGNRPVSIDLGKQNEEIPPLLSLCAR